MRAHVCVGVPVCAPTSHLNHPVVLSGADYDVRTLIINTLDAHHQSKQAWKLISQYNLRTEDFPHVRRARVLAELNWLSSSIIKECRATGLPSPVSSQQLDAFIARHPEEVLTAVARIHKALGPDSPLTRRLVTVHRQAPHFPGVTPMSAAEVTAFDDAPLPALDTPCLTLPKSVAVEWVDDLLTLAPAAAAMAEARAVGFDWCVVPSLGVCGGLKLTPLSPGVSCVASEWEPASATANATRDPVALLQLAIPGRVFLLDIPKLLSTLPSDTLDLHLAPVFNRVAYTAAQATQRGPDIAAAPPTASLPAPTPSAAGPLLIGFSCGGDLKNLAAACPDLLAFRNLAKSGQVVDLCTLAPVVFPSPSKRKPSLADLAQLLLGKPMDKRARLSSWGHRPLMSWQREYAALDAHVLLELHEKMSAMQAAQQAAAAAKDNEEGGGGAKSL